MNANAGSREDEIEREIDETRAELDRTLRALQERMSVRRRVDDMISSARERGLALAETARDSFGRHRTPILLAGAALAVVLVARGLSRRGRRGFMRH